MRSRNQYIKLLSLIVPSNKKETRQIYKSVMLAIFY